MRRWVRRLGCVLAVSGTVGIGFAATPADAASNIVVSPGQSIQQAINQAQPGDTITVLPGTYPGNLLVAKHDLTLRTIGATIVPATRPLPTPCAAASGAPTVDGICVVGVIDPTTRAVLHRVQGFTLEGFTVSGFSGNGAFAYGARDLHARSDSFIGNGGYGIFALNSLGTHYQSDTSHDNGDAGFYIGESQNADAVVENNRSWNNRGEGILFRDSTGGPFNDNVIFGNCAGLITVDAAAPGPSRDAVINNNVVLANDNVCPPSGAAPPMSGIGIAIVGGHSIMVHDNFVAGNQANGPTFAGGGIVVISGSPIGGAKEADVSVHDNTALGNAPADLVWDGLGHDIVFRRNACTTSSPPGLCHG
jgi:nitrous oxidase accessory protein NosD